MPNYMKGKAKKYSYDSFSKSMGKPKKKRKKASTHAATYKMNTK